MLLGTEWLVDAEGCRPEALRDLDVLRALLDDVVRKLELHVVGSPAWHRFPEPGGITALLLLTESHLACHTYPEHGSATFNLYCCRPRPRYAWEDALRTALGARRVRVHVVERTSEPRRGGGA